MGTIFGSPTAVADRHAIGRVRHLGDFHAEAHINLVGDRADHGRVAPRRHVAEEATFVLQFVPHPAQRLAVGAVCGLALDIGLERLTCSPVSRRGQPQSLDEGIDCFGHRSVWSELAEKRFLGRRESLELQIKAACQLARGQAPALPAVVGDRLRQGIRLAAWNSRLIGKSAQRIADRHVYPRTAQINRPAIEVNGVKPPADTVSW